jgi:hypothetical protein
MPRVDRPSPLTIRPPVEEFRDYHDQGGCLRSPVIWLPFLLGLLFGLFGKAC